MNKKTLIAAPLAVLAMGLTSCNKSWPTITFDEAKVISTKIIEEALKKEEYIPHGNVTMTAKSEKKISNKTVESIEGNGSFAFNIPDAYYCETIKQSGVDPDEGKMTFESKSRNFFNDNKCISTNDYAYTYVDNTTDYPTKDKFKEEVLEKAGKNTMFANVETYINDLDNTKEMLDVVVGKVKKDSSEYASYSFNSNNKEKNLQLNFKAKISDYSGTIIDKLFAEVEVTLSDFKTVEYAQAELEIKFEDYKITYFKENLSCKATDDDDRTVEYTSNQTYSTNYNNANANYDISNFVEDK